MGKIRQSFDDAGMNGVVKGGGLFENFFAHKVLIAVFLRLLHVPLGGEKLFLHRSAVHGADGNGTIGSDFYNLAVFQSIIAFGVLQNRGNIRSQKALAVAHSGQQGAVQAGAVYFTGPVGEQNAESVGAFHLCAGFPDGGDRVAVVAAVQNLGGDFGIGLGLEGVSFGGQLVFQFRVVFDDAVVYKAQPLCAVRMGVDVGRNAVGSPTGMPDAAASRQRMGCQSLGKHRQPAGGFDGFEAALAEYGNARRVIAAIFQRAKTFQQDTDGVFRAGVTYNTTHIQFSLSM